MLLLALLLAVVGPAQAAGAGAAGGASWRWPLRGEVITPFRLVPNPFAPGQHRGIDIAARAGARARSVCEGRVSFAGRVPGRGCVVTVVCGALVATYLELGSLAVRRDAQVGTGAPIGTVAASHLQLGARRTGRRNGYVDPLTLLETRHPPPLGAAPPRRTPPHRTPPRASPKPSGRVPHPEPLPAPSPAAAPRPQPMPAPSAAARRLPERVPAPSSVAAPRPGTVPIAAWLGLALFTAGTPVGAVVRRRRRTAAALDLRTADEGA